MDTPGCFRCHDGNHVSSDGRKINDDCDVCHDLLATEERDPKILKDLGNEPVACRLGRSFTVDWLGCRAVPEAPRRCRFGHAQRVHKSAGAASTGRVRATSLVGSPAVITWLEAPVGEGCGAMHGSSVAPPLRSSKHTPGAGSSVGRASRTFNVRWSRVRIPPGSAKNSLRISIILTIADCEPESLCLNKSRQRSNRGTGALLSNATDTALGKVPTP